MWHWVINVSTGVSRLSILKRVQGGLFVTSVSIIVGNGCRLFIEVSLNAAPTPMKPYKTNYLTRQTMGTHLFKHLHCHQPNFQRYWFWQPNEGRWAWRVSVTVALILQEIHNGDIPSRGSIPTAGLWLWFSSQSLAKDVISAQQEYQCSSFGQDAWSLTAGIWSVLHKSPSYVLFVFWLRWQSKACLPQMRAGLTVKYFWTVFLSWW